MSSEVLLFAQPGLVQLGLALADSSGPVGQFLSLVLLLVLSASFSGSETALFSLSHDERVRAGARVESLLKDPRGLLVSVLFANLMVNFGFFALAGRMVRSAQDSGALPSQGWVSLLWGLAALLAMLVFGEILPKNIAWRGRIGIARASTGVLTVLVRVFTPVRRTTDWILELCYRVLGDRATEQEALTPEVLADVLERSAKGGELPGQEVELAVEIIELRGVRVREIMKPRVELLFLDAEETDREALIQRALEERASWILICEGGPDQILGRVSLRVLLLEPDCDLRQALRPVHYFPEVAGALDLLRYLRAEKTAHAVVLDEWGGTAGLVSLEDVFEEIVGDLRLEGEERAKPVVPLGEGRFRVSGQLPIRDWNEHFGRRVVPMEFETLGGLVTAIVGRIPRHGDEVRQGDLVAKVHSMRGRRIESLDVQLLTRTEQLASNGGRTA